MTIAELMALLDGADAGTVNRIAWEHGSLPTRLAMLGLASIRKGESPLWWGYPPGVFIGYKWAGEPMRRVVAAVAAHVRSRGYRVFLDVEQLDAEADAYFRIPGFIASLQQCTFYLLLLTKASADAIGARERHTTWLFDEYQHAARLVNAGRLILVPVLLEPDGTTDHLPLERVLDLTEAPDDFSGLDAILTPQPPALADADVEALSTLVERFDTSFLSQQWEASADLLRASPRFAATFDHGFRRMLHAIYTADVPALEAVMPGLHDVYGQGIVQHFYRGYCARHGIPDRTLAG
jgi:hypothetical protein